MKLLKNYLLNKTLITWIALCCVALMTTSCLNQKGENAGVEERIPIQDSALNPSSKSWAALGVMCANPSLTEAEAVVCKLDELLEEVAKSGKPLSDYEIEVKDWIQSALDVRNQVCKDEKEITRLVVGTMRVLEGRGLVSLPFVASAVTASPKFNYLVRKIIYAVVIESVQNGCLINPDELKKVLGFGGSGPGTVGPVNPVNGGSNGGGSTVGPGNPGNPGSISAVCFKVETQHKLVCEPTCLATNSCDVASCDNIVKMCKQYSCQCK